MVRRYALRDDQWERIKDFLPGREGHVGGTAADNRLFVDAVLYRYRAGVPWRDLPERFGDWKNTHRRWGRWAERGVLEKIFKHWAGDANHEYAMIDSTIVRAHQHSAGAQKMWRRPSHRAKQRGIKHQDQRHGGGPGQSDWLCAHARPAIWMERMFCCRALRRKRYWPTKAMMLMIASSRHFCRQERPWSFRPNVTATSSVITTKNLISHAI